MVPPPGDWRVEVERVRRVAVGVCLRKGHIPLDWRRRASMLKAVTATTVNSGDERCKTACKGGER